MIYAGTIVVIIVAVVSSIVVLIVGGVIGVYIWKHRVIEKKRRGTTLLHSIVHCMCIQNTQQLLSAIRRKKMRTSTNMQEILCIVVR